MINKEILTDLYASCFAYIDYVIVFGKTAVEVIKHTCHILDLMWANKLRIGGLKGFYFYDAFNF